MKKKLASIEVIESLTPAVNSDNLEIVGLKGLGWDIVSKRGTHKVGDKVLFICIDTVLERKPYNEFLFTGSKANDNCVRLVPVKLRGNPSMGIVIPIKEVPELEGNLFFWPKIGKDYSERVGVTKYQKVPDEAAKNWFVRKYEYIKWRFFGKGAKPVVPKSPFPDFLTKTDEDNIQTSPTILDDFRDPKNGGIYISLKADGSSATFWNADSDRMLGVASRSVTMREGDDNNWTKQLPNMLDKVKEGFYVQGELIGEGIQQNKMKVVGQKILAFQVAKIKTKEILDYDDFVKYCDENKLERAPEIPVPEGWEKFTVQDWVAFSEKVAKYGKEPGEGIVIRTKKNVNANKRGSHCGRLSCKVINPSYKDA